MLTFYTLWKTAENYRFLGAFRLEISPDMAQNEKLSEIVFRLHPHTNLDT